MKILIALLLVSTSSVWAGRPDQAFSFNEDTCVCRNETPVSSGDCAKVCRGKRTDGAEVLYADFSVGSVLANSSLKHVKNWCYKYLIGDGGFPKCELEAVDETGAVTTLTKFSFPKNNSFTADVTALEADQRYWFRLVEKTSGTKSIPHEVHIFDPVGVPLKQSKLNRYACVTISSKTKSHFFYQPRTAPSPVIFGTDLYCHDVAQYGERDDATYPRLENTDAVATLWNQQNYLFFDNNGDGVLDVNELFMKKVKENAGTIKGTLRVFGNLSSPGTRQANLAAGNDGFENLGFVMSYWVSKNTFLSSCPSGTGKPELKAMNDITGASTEGLYIADRSENEVKDYLFVRETDLKAVWFYLKNGVATRPTEDIVQFQTIFFHFPFNKENPLVKGPNQKTYRVRSPQEIGQLTTLQAFLPETGEMISYPSHDRKIACIPKL